MQIAQKFVWIKTSFKTCEDLQTYIRRTKTQDVEETTSPGQMPIKPT